MQTLHLDTSVPRPNPGSQHPSIPQPVTPIAQKLEELANSPALLSRDRQILAILRERDEEIISGRELQLLAEMWQRHRGQR